MKRSVVCGTIIEKEGDKLYNTSYMLDRHGQIEGKYRKIHLFNYMGGREGEFLTAGEETVVVNTDIGRIGMSVCFDIKFPLHSRELMKKGAQIIVSPTAWGSPIVEFGRQKMRCFLCQLIYVVRFRIIPFLHLAIQL